MRRAMVVLTAATAAALLVPGSSIGDEGNDKVDGKATNLFLGVGPMTLTVQGGRSKADGSKPKGFIKAEGDITGGTIPLGEFKFAGKITCLRVDGNRVAIKYRFDKAEGDSGENFKDGGVQIFIEDNGRPNQERRDRVTFDPPMPEGAFQAAETVCSDPNNPGQPYDEVDKGDYKVKDAGSQNNSQERSGSKEADEPADADEPAGEAPPAEDGDEGEVDDVGAETGG